MTDFWYPKMFASVAEHIEWNSAAVFYGWVLVFQVKVSILYTF